jgi:hypothetical protein
MAMVIGIIGVEPSDSGTLRVDLQYHHETREGQVVHLYIGRDEFTDWEQFQAAVERRAPTTIEANSSSVPKSSNLRGDWEHWTAILAAGKL